MTPGCSQEAGEALQGKYVLKEGTTLVLEQLRAAGVLLIHEPFKHRYPYDWRAKQPVILRCVFTV